MASFICEKSESEDVEGAHDSEYSYGHICISCIAVLICFVFSCHVSFINCYSLLIIHRNACCDTNFFILKKFADFIIYIQRDQFGMEFPLCLSMCTISDIH